MTDPTTMASSATAAGRRRRGTDSYDNIEPVLSEFALLAPEDSRRPVLRDQIVRRCLPLADHIARRYTGRGENYDDLHQIACLGLVLAIDRYDPARGRSFLAFAVPTMMGEIRRHFRDHTWAVRVPRRVKEIQLTIGPTIEAMAQKSGRMPTAREIAVELNIDLSEVTQALLAGNAYRADSMDTAPGDGEDGPAPIADTHGAEDPEYELAVQTMVASPLLRDLPELDQQVLSLRFFGEQSQSQIAATLGVSQMQISRMLARILGHLRTAAER